MSSPDKKAASAAGGKTARACDSCLRKRARWYCAADDAFLCQACDSSVHSANSLARRHERVRLKTASFKPSDQPSNHCAPSWHQGFRRKARTPRPAKQRPGSNPVPLVPEIGSDDQAALYDENEEQLLYRVPIFDPFVAEFCKPETPPAVISTVNMGIADVEESKVVNLENLHRLLPSDMDLAEFAADVESLLGRGLDEDSFGMEGLGLLEGEEGGNLYSDHQYNDRFGGSVIGRVKIEEEGEEEGCNNHLDQEMEISRETLDLNFECYTPTTGGEEDEEKVMLMKKSSGSSSSEEIMKRRMSLRLDYDAVIAAWASQGSPWTTGDWPEFNPDDCWIDSLGTWGTDQLQLQGYGGDQMRCSSTGGLQLGLIMGGGGREARVSRYREKRRTRLFSKKIRYEVRKLNAEKRPRMKGRFVKRASFVGVVGSGFPF